MASKNFVKFLLESAELLKSIFISGSDTERADLKQAYLNGKGDMGYITDHVQFARSEHEPRFREILDVRTFI